MLGRKDYTREEFAAAQQLVSRQLDAYRQLAAAVAATSDPAAKAALDAFEPLFTTAVVMELDRFFVHRIRSVSGKDTNPLTELELILEGLLADGTLIGNKVIKYVPEQAASGLTIGDVIELDIDRTSRCAEAFLAEVERRMVPSD